jgi:hypothetical protein
VSGNRYVGFFWRKSLSSIVVLQLTANWFPATGGESIIESSFQSRSFRGGGALLFAGYGGYQLHRAHTLKRELPRLLLAAALSLMSSPAGLGQQNQPDVVPDAPAPSQQQTDQQTGPQTARQNTNPVTNGVDKFLELQRRSLVFPDLATARGPLSSFDKLRLAANNTVSLSSVGAVFLGSLYGQATDRPAGWGQGWGAYGQRFGADLARVASYNFFGTFMIASLTHEDPRFYVRKNLNFGGSVKYAARRLVITRNDSGEEVVNYSGLLGPLAGEALANSYYPQGSRGVGSTAIRYATDVGWRFAGNLLRQYWPTIDKRLEEAPEPTPSTSAKH